MKIVLMSPISVCSIFICVTIGLVGCQQEMIDASLQRSPVEADAQKVEYIQPTGDVVAEGIHRRPLELSNTADTSQFSRVNGKSIGIDFHNQLNKENIRDYLYAGAGLTVGDIDQNGLPDLFLVSQDGQNKLFKQTKPWVFEDVTSSAGIAQSDKWGSGAAFVDIDDDGDLDLYVCNKGAHDEVYMNEGDGSFKQEELGAGDASLRAPSMVAFSDYDQDGDLDFYRAETRLISVKEMFNYKLKVVKDDFGEWKAAPWQKDEFEIIDGNMVELGTNDHLYRNEGSPKPGDIAFRDVSRKSGISTAREHGLAAIWWDYNNDNAPDLYVSNDFHTPDHLFHNNQDGTFSDTIENALPYTSWFSMGSDFADINNDGWFDYLTTDMSATTHFKQKTTMGAMSESAWFLDNLEPRQYMRNALHVNTGIGKFIDVAFHAGVDSTDWTWAGIFGDLDNDGFEDAYFTNGVERNVQDSDLSNRMDAVKKQGGTMEDVLKVLHDSPRLTEVNLAFRNTGDLKFENATESWGLADPTVSHGAVLVDLDRDGDLDIVTNNMNDPVGIYRNNSSNNNAILVSLRGARSNHFGLGARVVVKLSNSQMLSRIMTSSRGYMSGVEPVLHFGLGNHSRLESLTITWPSGQIQEFDDLEAGFHYTVNESDEAGANAIVLAKKEGPERSSTALFAESDDALGIEFSHKENDYDDFSVQPLLPNRLSRVGPAMAIGDANGDGRPDVFLGSAAGYLSSLYLQAADGKYNRVSAGNSSIEREFEDVAAAWFDSDQDGDLDLYVVTGGAHKKHEDDHYLDRLLLNDGTGKLTAATADVLPELKNSGSCVAPCDFDGDGDIDLFVGARHVPERYPTDPESDLLVNNGGKFEKIDSPVSSAGMVTDATWADLDADQRPDLVVATEWGPIRVYRNTTDGLVEFTGQAGLGKLTGWWTCVKAGDFDGDGDIDLIAGNFGSNTKYHVDVDHPATLFASDFGNQGKLQLVEAKHAEGKLLPVRGRSCSTTAMPHLKKLAPSYADFACKSLQDLYTLDSLNNAIKLQATTLKSTLFKNDGSGHFMPEPLPYLAQMSPVMDIALGDFNGDGVLDAALGQNFNDAQRETGRMNAGLGVILKGSLESGLSEMWPAISGFHQRTNLRTIEAVDLNQDGLTDLLSANNGEKVTVHLGRKAAISDKKVTAHARASR